MEDLAAIEKFITHLCERAEKKGWEFTTLAERRGRRRKGSARCGCVLQACASELRFRSWEDAGHHVGLVAPSHFGVFYDFHAENPDPSWTPENPYSPMAKRLADRFVHKKREET